MITSGTQIRNARKQLGWSRADLAHAAGLHRNAVLYWERKPSIAVWRGWHGKPTQSPTVERMEKVLRHAGIRFPRVRLPKRKIPKFLTGEARLIACGILRPDGELHNFRPLRAGARAHHGVQRSRPSGAQRLEAAAKGEWRVMRPKVECDARTRRGTSCRRPAYPNGRCRNHGGLATGPRTSEGKARSLDALRRGREGRRAIQRPGEP